MRGLASLLLALGLAAGAIGAVSDPIVATSWDVRRDAEELLADLQAKRGEIPGLLERVHTLLADHGDKLISAGGVFAPLSEVLAAQLISLGLATEFQRTFADIADRRLQELLAAKAADSALRRLALSYPGTPTAAKAWHYLANSSWDHGKLGAYVYCARKAGEGDDVKLKERVAAGLRLLAGPPAGPLPPSLDGLDEMWRLDVEEAEVKAPRRNPRDPRQQNPIVRTFALSHAHTDLTAASDGMRFFLFDHLVGRVQGRIYQLGESYLNALQCAPASGPDCFVALGLLQNQSATLVAIDRLGEQRWRIRTPTLGPYANVSPPLVVDDYVVFSAMVSSDEGPELRLYAYRLSNGSPAWDILIAKLPVQMRQFFDGSRGGGAMPTLCTCAGSIMVLSNNGIIAKVASDGAVERIWSYPSTGVEFDELSDRRREVLRNGQVMSDGYFTVATPADAEGLVLILGPEDAAPRHYTGDGSRGQLLDVADGVALLGGTQIACLDLRQGKLRWNRSGPAMPEATGAIGQGRALIAGRERMALLDLENGDQLSLRTSEPPITFTAADGMVIIGSRDRITAFGKAQAFMAEQLANAKRNPKDFRPLIALASLYQAQGDSDRAYQHLLQALERGAPPEYAERAARLIRLRLELVLDDAQAFPAILAQLQAVAGYDVRLAAEVAMWRGRHAELRKDAAAAGAAYREVLQQPLLRVPMGNRLEVQVQALAAAGLARLKLAPAPPWLAPAPASSQLLPNIAGAWTNTGNRGKTSIFTADLAIGYVDGVLNAIRLGDGGEAWWRKPNRPLLGVQNNTQVDNARGVTLDVLDGTSAATAGLRNGDLLISFNDHTIGNFQQDLIPAVVDTGIRGKFTAKILRNGQAMTIAGVLGGEMVEPITANATTVLIWSLLPKGISDPGWIAALDLATGKELWKQALAPATTAQPAVRPLLTADDLVIAPDVEDVVAIAPRGETGAKERWRLRGGAEWLNHAQLLGDRLLLLSDVVHNQVRLVDLASGEVLFVLPADGETQALLSDGELFTRTVDSKLACWDLGQGKLRWRSEKPVFVPIAVAGDSVFALNLQKQLVLLDRFSGKVRRLFGEWNAVEDWRVEGNRLYAYVRRLNNGRLDLGQALASVALPGGAVLWEKPLPRGVEVRQVLATASGFGCVIGESEQSPALLALDANGDVAFAAKLGDNETIRAGKGGVLAIGGKGLRVLGGVLPSPPAPVACTVAAGQGDLAAIGKAALPTLNWQPVDKAAYAVARLDGSLLVFCRLPAEVEALEFRLGDAGAPIDLLNQALTVQRHQTPRFVDCPGGWQISGAQRLPTDEGTWLCVARLDPPPGRISSVPLQIRVAAAGVVDGPDAPWWLRQAWRSLSNGP